MLLTTAKTLIANEAHLNSFEIVIDCTSFLPSSEVPLPWLKLMLEYLPSDIVAQFSKAYIVNANGIACNFLRKAFHAFGSKLDDIAAAYTDTCSDVYRRKSHRGILFARLGRIRINVSNGAHGRMLYVLLYRDIYNTKFFEAALEREPKQSFKDVMQEVQGAVRVPVVFQLGTSHLRITIVRGHIANFAVLLMCLQD